MRKYFGFLIIGLVVSALGGPAQALTGPANGGYLWMTDIQSLGGQEYVDLELSVLQVGSDYKGLGSSFTTFTPMIPDNYTDPAS